MSLLNKHGFTAREMQYLAPDPIRNMNRRERIKSHVFWVGLLIFAVFMAVMAYRVLYPIIHAQASYVYNPVVMVNGEETDLLTLCAQYRSDKIMTGEPMSKEMITNCGF